VEGLAWAAEARSAADVGGVVDDAARGAAGVGAVMCGLMGVRDRHALARACDLGAAMQLTNIARDVGEDALEARLYLPTDWLDEAGIDRAAFLAQARPTKAIRAMTRRLVMEANRLYYRSEAGIGALPLSCRPGIYAARLIYAGIAGRLRGMEYDSISARARTGKAAKLGWLAEASLRTAASTVMPKSAVLYAPPLPEVAFLVDAAAGPEPRARSDSLFEALAALEARRQADRAILMRPRAPLA